MVLGNKTKLTALQETNRQVECWGAELPLVIAVWREVKNRWAKRKMTKDMGDHSIDFRVTTAAFFIGWPSAIAKHRENQPMLDAVCLVLIEGKPGNRSDGARCEEKTIAVSRLYT